MHFHLCPPDPGTRQGKYTHYCGIILRFSAFFMPEAFRQIGARVPAWECGLRAILTEFFAPGPDIGPRRKNFDEKRPPNSFKDGLPCACLAKKGEPWSTLPKPKLG